MRRPADLLRFEIQHLSAHDRCIQAAIRRTDVLFETKSERELMVDSLCRTQFLPFESALHSPVVIAQRLFEPFLNSG